MRVTRSCAQRRRWSRLRAWTARAAATAGLLGGAWLLAAGPAEAAPQHEVPAVQVEVAEPDIAPLSIERPAAPGAPDPVRAEESSDAAQQLGVADLATDITTGVREELEPVTEAAEPERAGPDETLPPPAEQATPTTPDTASAPDTTAPRGDTPEHAAPAAAPDGTDSEHVRPEHVTPAAAAPEPQPTPAPAPADHGGTAPHPVPPIAPPVAVVTAAAAPGGSGPGLRWMHAVLPTRPQLPGPVRAVGGHVETVTSRGIALIEPSTSPD